MRFRRYRSSRGYGRRRPSFRSFRGRRGSVGRRFSRRRRVRSSLRGAGPIGYRL